MPIKRRHYFDIKVNCVVLIRGQHLFEAQCLLEEILVIGVYFSWKKNEFAFFH